MISVGVEDGAFPISRQLRKNFQTLLVTSWLHEFRIIDWKFQLIQVDGLDATRKLLSILNTSPLEPDIILMGGVSFAGFNLIDPNKIHDKAGIPVVVVTMTKPDNKAVKEALQKHFPDWRKRWKVFSDLGTIHKVKSNPRENPIYIENIGISKSQAMRMVQKLTVWGRLPEPLRISKMVAHQLTENYWLLDALRKYMKRSKSTSTSNSLQTADAADKLNKMRGRT